MHEVHVSIGGEVLIGDSPCVCWKTHHLSFTKVPSGQLKTRFMFPEHSIRMATSGAILIGYGESTVRITVIDSAVTRRQRYGEESAGMSREGKANVSSSPLRIYIVLTSGC